jgi:hypothetical protein
MTTPDRLVKARATQVEKYGGEAGYKAEMQRRRSLVKKPGFASMEKGKAAEAANKRWRVYREKNSVETNDQSEEDNQETA